MFIVWVVNKKSHNIGSHVTQVSIKTLKMRALTSDSILRQFWLDSASLSCHISRFYSGSEISKLFIPCGVTETVVGKALCCHSWMHWFVSRPSTNSEINSFQVIQRLQINAKLFYYITETHLFSLDFCWHDILFFLFLREIVEFSSMIVLHVIYQ